MRKAISICIISFVPLVLLSQVLEWSAPIYGYRSTIDENNNIIVADNFKGIVDFDPGPGKLLYESSGDLDAFIAKYDPDGVIIWVAHLTGSSTAYSDIRSVQIDKEGNIIVIGIFTGSIDLDPGGETYNLEVGYSDQDVFVAKYDSIGALKWGFQLGGPKSDHGLNLVTGAKGDVYISLEYNTQIDIDPGEQSKLFYAEGSSVIIAKYSKNGDYIWARSIDYRSTDIVDMPMTIDAHDNIYLAHGFGEDSILFDDDNDSSLITGNNNGFIVKYDSSGDFRWVRNIVTENENPYQTRVSDISSDQNGNIFLTGTFHTYLNFESKDNIYSLVSNGLADIFTAKIDSSGSWIWANNYGSDMDDAGECLHLDSIGNLYLAGVFRAHINKLKLEKDNDAYNYYLLKLTGEGDVKWTSGFPRKRPIYDLVVDGNNQILSLAGKTIYKFSQHNVELSHNDLLVSDTIYSINTLDEEILNTIQLKNVDSCLLTYQEKIDFFYIEDISLTDSIMHLSWLIVQENSFHRFSTDVSIGSAVKAGATRFYLTIECSDKAQSNTFVNYSDLSQIIVHTLNHSLQNDIEMYPNPTTGNVVIHGAVDSDLIVYSISGKVLFLKRNINETEIVDLSNLLSGVYIFQINRDSTFLTKKIVKK